MAVGVWLQLSGGVTHFEVGHYESAKICFEEKVRASILVTVVDPIVSNNLRWAEMTAEKQAEWAAYRTALLDITDQAGFPADITWPTKPE